MRVWAAGKGGLGGSSSRSSVGHHHHFLLLFIIIAYTVLHTVCATDTIQAVLDRCYPVSQLLNQPL